MQPAEFNLKFKAERGNSGWRENLAFEFLMWGKFKMKVKKIQRFESFKFKARREIQLFAKQNSA